MTTVGLRTLMHFILLSLASALLVGCLGRLAGRSHEADGSLGVRLGQEFNLRVGQQAAVEGESLKIRFASVANDSRCPVDVTCVWAGNAEVLIEAEARGNHASLKLNTLGGTKFPKERSYQQYIVGLVRLVPQPRKDSGIKTTDYVATLVIRKE